MPLQNRVTPYGEIVALPERGLLLGNRGILHDDAQQIVRLWQVRRWIACRLEFRGRRRPLMRPHSYTELFFLDEATAFAAGHRPCAECRYADYQRFKAAWAVGIGDPISADHVDTLLHADRLEDRDTLGTHGTHGTHGTDATGGTGGTGTTGATGRTPRRKRCFSEQVAALPDGTCISLDGSAWLLWRGQLLEWSAGGYRVRRPIPPAASHVAVLTPRALVAVLRAGYPLQVHPSADETL